MLNVIYFQTLDDLFLTFFVTYYLFLKFFDWIEKTKLFGLLLNAKNNFLKLPKDNSTWSSSY